jgi:hypothetical protein
MLGTHSTNKKLEVLWLRVALCHLEGPIRIKFVEADILVL